MSLLLQGLFFSQKIKLIPGLLFRLNYRERKIKNVMQQFEKLNRKMTCCASHTECSCCRPENWNHSHSAENSSDGFGR